MRVSLLLIPLALAAQAAVAAPPCAVPAHRQFDFWIGDWTVDKTDGGQFAGRNRIEPMLDGCALQETWVGANGYRGNSYSIYDAARGVWHQTWVDSEGGLLVLEGRFSDGKMVLEGPQKKSDGSSVQNRVTWTPLAGGKLRQRWDATADGGKTWKPLFDGTYTKRVGEPIGGGGGGGKPLQLRSDI
jgi:hypothetical protein